MTLRKRVLEQEQGTEARGGGGGRMVVAGPAEMLVQQTKRSQLVLRASRAET